MIVAIVAIFQVLGLFSAVHAVMSTRTPQGAIAWAVSLVTFPYVAVPAYWIFGRDKFRGYVLARQEDIESIQYIAREARDSVEDSAADEGPFNPNVSIAEKLARIPLTGGNEVELLIDGRTAWIGGHNVGDEYLGKDPKIGNWRDTHVRIDGPAVIGAQLSFAEDWHWATDEIPQDLDWSVPSQPAADKKALVIASGPADELETASLIYTHAINAAEQRIWIASPYFVPDDAVVQAIQLDGLRKFQTNGGG